MSASLVGSEMCIRDSVPPLFCSTNQQEVPRKNSLPRLPRSQCPQLRHSLLQRPICYFECLREGRRLDERGQVGIRKLVIALAMLKPHLAKVGHLRAPIFGKELRQVLAKLGQGERTRLIQAVLYKELPAEGGAVGSP
eukprot:3188755-Alexandrium_andersonii.AAC.1